MNFLLSIFNNLTSDIWGLRIPFGRHCFLAVVMTESFEPESFLMKRDPEHPEAFQGFAKWHSWRQYTQLKSGLLYEYKFKKLRYFVFVPHEAREVLAVLKKKIPNLNDAEGCVWFSYMAPGCSFAWHIDPPLPRWHLVLRNDLQTASILFKDGNSIQAKPGDMFIFDPSRSHSVPAQTEVRLHLVATLNQGAQINSGVSE